MSELINNRQQRRETLKQIIRDIHQNQDPQELKERFKTLIKDVGPTEISQLEQELIAEGLPEQEIKRLCDVHVAVFKESLDQQPKPEDTPGHPIHTFKKENGALEQVVGALRAIFDALKIEGPEPNLLAHWAEQHHKLLQLERHYSRKENILFPFLESHGVSGPPAVMWSIQDDIRAQLKQISQFLEKRSVSSTELDDFLDATALPALQAISEMIYKEDNIMFPMSMETLSEAEWAKILQQSDELGYCLVEPDQGWQPSPDANADVSGPSSEPNSVSGTLKFATGILGLNEISAIFDHLPVDVTYVDKDNRVKYFSAAKDRVFPRTPAIIGRTVQNCHPPDSVHVVNKIVDDFRAGRRDHADFWLNVNDRFIYIRYFAVRDVAGVYMGTLEVTQDVTEVRQLQGERRILND
ncbi:MAG: DUF438 domain-containing protein [Peptococcaceae bacterium]|nr:DUF438 domain-containing protein [Peptococcaceae bacterium]